MRCRKLLLAVATIATINIKAQELPATNILLIHSNVPLQFDKVNAATVHNAVATVIKISDARIKAIAAVASKAHTLNNTLLAIDELQYDITDLQFKLGLIAATYADDDTRDAANQEAGALSEYANNLFLNEDLYKALKDFSFSSSSLKPDARKYLKETIIAFEKNGMKLNEQGKKDLQVLQSKLIKLGIEFDRNISESKDSIAFSEQDLKGVKEHTKAPWKRGNGSYMVYVNGPNYVEVMSNAESDSTRHTMYLHYNNRAYPKNIQVLDSLFFYRSAFAKMLGFNSYAAYSVIDKMAGSPANVWNFENELITKLTPNVTKELAELKAIKHPFHPGLPDEIYRWDIAYYKKKLLDTKYQLNTDEVKEYFEMNNTLRGMFKVYENLFDIQIKEVHNIPVWFNKVKTFEMYKEGKKIGSFYLDLFPRLNKYTHFACFPISQYRSVDGKEVLPVSALICNFSEGNANEPTLLYHSDVVILFHEFGHLVHSMLGHPEIASQNSFAVKGDFVEAPSQFLENWVWQYESLKLFAKHYKTGAPLPVNLFDRLKATQQVGIATQYIGQLYLGILDFTYEDKYDSIKSQSILDVAQNLSSIMQIPYVEGSHFIAGFTHLNGYAANYYGYLWSRVFAEDMFSVFKKNGVMNKATGVRYRKEILEKASTKDEKEMLRSFLGREPNSAAFLESLGIKHS